MLYNNLPDYSRRRRPSETGRRPGMPSQLPRRTPVAAGRAARSSVPSAWNRPQRQNIRQAGTEPRSFRLPGFSLPKISFPKISLRPRQIAVGLVLLVLALSFMTGTFPPSAITHAFANLTTSEAEKAAAAKKVRMDAYTAEINKLVAAHPGENIAVSTVDLSDNSALTLGDQGTFTAASTAKLITAVTLLHEVEAGKTSLNHYIDGVKAGDLLERMIVDSDNNAWEALNGYLTHDTLQAYTAGLGWTQYNTDINSLHPKDMALLAAKLYRGELLDQVHTKLLLSYMHDANKQEYIVSAVPTTGYTVYHKAGWLDGLMHDVAVITDGQRTIVLTIYTYSGPQGGDGLANQELFGQITKAALTAYFPPVTQKN